MFGLQITGPINCLGYLHAAPHYSLFTPAFVTCSTNAGEGLVKLVTCNMTYLDVGWTCGRVAHSWKSHKCARYRSEPQTMERLSGRHQAVSVPFPWFRRPYHSCKKECVLTYLQLVMECATFPHVHPCPGTSLHVTSISTRA